MEKTIRREAAKIKIEHNGMNISDTIIRALLQEGFEVDSKPINKEHLMIGEELTIYTKCSYRISETIEGNKCY